MPQITVILGSYNHGKYIGAAIQSVLDQTLTDWELIITDDGSTDNSVEVIRSFSDPRIRLFCFPENRSACVATLHSYEQAQGRYIALLGSDDQFMPDKLQRQWDFLEHHPQIGAVFSDAQIVDEAGDPLPGAEHFYQKIFLEPNRSRQAWLNHFFFRGNCLCHPSLLIRRECFEAVGFYDLRYANVTDLEYWVRLCSRYEIHILPEPLVKFRVRAQEANSSGDRPGPQNRAQIETVWTLRHYQSPEFLAQFPQIFPEASLPEGTPPELYPYYLARLALDQGDLLVHRLFGLDILYDLLGQPQIAAQLQAIAGFGVKQLIGLTGEVDALGYLRSRELGEELAQLYQHQAALAVQIQQQQAQIAELQASLAVSHTYATDLAAALAQKQQDLEVVQAGLETAQQAQQQLRAIAQHPLGRLYHKIQAWKQR